MSRLRLLPWLVLLMPTHAMPQQVRDVLDVVAGSNPTLRYGFYTQASGQVAMGRYYFVDDGENLRLSLVRFGKAAVELPVFRYARDEGVLEFGWDGKPNRKCRLDRENDQLLLGNCIEGLIVMPIAIRVVNRYDKEWTGLHFPVSHADIAIIEKAVKILESQDRRNLEGDRNCEDDFHSERFSAFCALYAASIEIDGEYRHRRPAMQAARDSLLDKFPGAYAHTLRDINNNASIPDEALVAALEEASALLRNQLGSAWPERVPR